MLISLPKSFTMLHRHLGAIASSLQTTIRTVPSESSRWPGRWLTSLLSQLTRPRHPARTLDDLSRWPSRYTFALISDPQVMERDATSLVSQTSARNFSHIIEELNSIRPILPFVVLNGDLVQVMIPAHQENFLERLVALKPLPILVHGNHDGRSPYTELRRWQQRFNGSSEVMVSFDCGDWHFVVLPCNLPATRDDEVHLLTWLDGDLQTCGDRPVMVFQHLHLLPQGLTQLEWYTFRPAFRQEILDVLTRYDNVRYVISGHVHNGIKVSVKTAWTYRETHFISAPTCTGSRNFGEEFPEFAAGAQQDAKTTGGGYYLLIDVDRTRVQIRGRLVGTPRDYYYPDSFTPYQDQDPFWFQPITRQPPAAALINSSFTQGLQGWSYPYRYLTDEAPGFVIHPGTAPDRPGQGLELGCREKGKLWANEEVLDAYQWVAVPDQTPLQVSMEYFIEPGNLKRGGGYLYVLGFRDDVPACLVLLHWSDGNLSKNQNTILHILYTATGQRHSPTTFAMWGQQRRALFIQLPPVADRWHSVTLHLDRGYAQATQGDRSFSAFGINRALLGIGVWCGKRPRSRSRAFFNDVKLIPDLSPSDVANPPLVVDNEPVAITADAFHTELGRDHLSGERMARRLQRRRLAPSE